MKATFQLDAGHYCAGIVFDVQTRRCVDAAPILFWMRGKKFEYVKGYCKAMGIKMRRVKNVD